MMIFTKTFINMNATAQSGIWTHNLPGVDITIDCNFNRIIVKPEGMNPTVLRYDHEPTLADLEKVKISLVNYGLIGPDD